MTPTFIALAASVAAATVIVILLIGESGDGVRREVQYTETVYGICVRCDVILIHYFPPIILFTGLDKFLMRIVCTSPTLPELVLPKIILIITMLRRNTLT